MLYSTVDYIRSVRLLKVCGFIMPVAPIMVPVALFIFVIFVILSFLFSCPIFWLSDVYAQAASVYRKDIYVDINVILFLV